MSIAAISIRPQPQTSIFTTKTCSYDSGRPNLIFVFVLHVSTHVPMLAPVTKLGTTVCAVKNSVDNTEEIGARDGLVATVVQGNSQSISINLTTTRWQ